MQIGFDSQCALRKVGCVRFPVFLLWIFLTLIFPSAINGEPVCHSKIAIPQMCSTAIWIWNLLTIEYELLKKYHHLKGFYFPKTLELLMAKSSDRHLGIPTWSNILASTYDRYKFLLSRKTWVQKEKDEDEKSKFSFQDAFLNVRFCKLCTSEQLWIDPLALHCL